MAEEVAADWWEGIAGIRTDIDALPFIRGLADGTLAEEPFRFYLAQDALYLRDYARVLAAAARLAPTSAEQAFWAQSAHGAIAGELELHASWLTPERGVTGRPSPRSRPRRPPPTSTTCAPLPSARTTRS
ncbi:hypothetical protein [Microbacterium sp. NIBRBAC000506063]|uniref:hypothetical protein n=1 Tax=Microbacterium sp. NIBRBAC000506063 TaxID=2734618 RepID=UPI0021D3FA15|nr:hypothetical protein [Microbacterium sp. NIBRBAC000506063]